MSEYCECMQCLGDLHSDLGQVVRVAQFGGDVEAELVGVLHRAVAQL